jgi:broad specificity phosphatase PhoE
MSTKIIYFVRHGETVLNATGIRQGAEGPLTEKGKAQALETAKKFPLKKKSRPQIIFASPFQRTRETAEIIARELGFDPADIHYLDLLKERRNPHEIIGHSKDELTVRRIVDKIDKGFHEDDLRYSDEENFLDLRERAHQLLQFIRGRREKRILMVSHSIFLGMVVSYMLRGKELTASEFNKLSYLNPINNASLTICTCTTRFLRKPIWKLLMWNDIVQPEDEQNVL